MLSHLNAARSAAIVLPFAIAGCAQYPGSVIQSGIPYPTSSRSAAVVIPTAERYLGVRYTWGGESPRTGFDCSGFVQYVFERHGVGLPRTSRAQASAGARVPLDFAYLRAGDLIMFANPGRAISHVAIYAGDRRIIHSSKSGSGVRYDDLSSGRGAWYRENAVVARRVGTEAQGRGIVRDIVSELRSAGVRVDFPLDLGDLAPKP
ncbi:MAG: C40 family peptidase [Gemmatimonadaceae bacterium]